MNYKYLFFLLLFTFSCKSGNNDLFEFNPKNNQDNKITLADIAEDIAYIPLDNQFLLGYCKKIEITYNSIYISESSNGLIAFDREGHSARKIGEKGRGPGEYRVGFWYAVDSNNDRIYILDNGRKIKVYSKSGNFIREISLDDYEVFFHEIESFGSNLFLSQYISGGKAKYNWVIIDTLANLVGKKDNSVAQFNTTLGPKGGIYKIGDKVCYWNCYSDTVFSISPDLNYKPSFLISQGEHRLPRSQFYLEGKKLSDYILINSIFETQRFWVVEYYFNEKGAIVMIEKGSIKSFYMDLLTGLDHMGRMINHGGIIDDLDGGPNFQPIGYFEEKGQDYLTGLLEPQLLKTHIVSSEFRESTPKYPGKKEALIKLAEQINETDNKILLLVKLKKKE